MKAVGYIRVSTEEQAREGVSLDAQHRRIEAWAVAQDAELVGFKGDEGVSGTIAPEKRPGLQQVLGMLAVGAVDTLVVLKLDRLSRKTRDVLDLVELSRKQNWSLVSVSESLDTSTAAGRLVVTVLAALAEMERDQIAERTVAALQEIRAQGRATSRFTPWGLRTVDDQFEVQKGDHRPLKEHAIEMELLHYVNRIREAGGGGGARRVANVLNSARWRNPRTNMDWTKRQAERLIVAAEKLE